jgi:hypothetical protein
MWLLLLLRLLNNCWRCQLLWQCSRVWCLLTLLLLLLLTCHCCLLLLVLPYLQHLLPRC